MTKVVRYTPRTSVGSGQRYAIKRVFKGGAAKTPQEKATEVGLKTWVKDYTRHTAISYRVRQTGDIHRTATWAGNSPAIIRSHYLGLVGGFEAEKFWSISNDIKSLKISSKSFQETLTNLLLLLKELRKYQLIPKSLNHCVHR